jgi:DNA-directed RNA polymerase III subunit RPC4
MKMEDDGDVSSENEEDAEFKRKDIDLIELSSDEDQAAPSARFRTNLPVRIGRKEHKERTLEINTEASTEASAKILQETEASGDSQANGQSKANKGEGRAKDIEITGEQNPSKGMQQEPEDTNVNVKSEPHSDDEMQVDAEQVGIGAGGQAAEPQGAPRAERKVRFQESKEPQLQTEEERAEWARFQANLRHIRTELGPEEESAVDGSGDVNMEDAAANARKPTRRDDQVYLFQLPPVIPELLEAKVKKEASDSHSKGPDLPPQPVKVDGVQVKTEEEFSSAIPKPAEGPRIGSGRVGKLRVHQSGRTTLDWGGVDFELTPGRPVSFLQEVVAMNVIPEEKQDVPEISGEAVSFGRVKGKFIVTPDFSTIFG